MAFFSDNLQSWLVHRHRLTRHPMISQIATAVIFTRILSGDGILINIPSSTSDVELWLVCKSLYGELHVFISRGVHPMIMAYEPLPGGQRTSIIRHGPKLHPRLSRKIVVVALSLDAPSKDCMMFRLHMCLLGPNLPRRPMPQARAVQTTANFMFY